MALDPMYAALEEAQGHIERAMVAYDAEDNGCDRAARGAIEALRRFLDGVCHLTLDARHVWSGTHKPDHCTKCGKTRTSERPGR